MICFIFRGNTPAARCLDALRRAAGPLTARAVAERVGVSEGYARQCLIALISCGLADFKTLTPAEGRPTRFYFPVEKTTEE